MQKVIFWCTKTFWVFFWIYSSNNCCSLTKYEC